MKNPWIVVGALAIVLVAVLVWYGNSSTEQNNAGITTGTVYRKGPENAKVRLVEYSDFQCPACAAFQPILADVLEAFPNDVSVEYRHFPLTAIHPYAEPAARAAEAAGQQGKFFEYHDKLFAEQAVWSKGGNPTGAFLRYADELGLDVERFNRHMRSSLLRDEVRADAAQGRELQLSGTPTFFLNDVRMDVTTYQEFYDAVARSVDPSYSQASGTDAVAPAAPVRFGI
jgi:protein-disulfide isomerase